MKHKLWKDINISKPELNNLKRKKHPQHMNSQSVGAPKRAWQSTRLCLRNQGGRPPAQGGGHFPWRTRLKHFLEQNASISLRKTTILLSFFGWICFCFFIILFGLGQKIKVDVVEVDLEDAILAPVLLARWFTASCEGASPETWYSVPSFSYPKILGDPLRVSIEPHGKTPPKHRVHKDHKASPIMICLKRQTRPVWDF